MKQVAISFVIPALNEELCLPNELKSIKQHMPECLSYEIVVADNGSTDNTVQIAESFGAYVLVNRNASIAQLRNLAVKQTRGEVLVFLDADITLTESWGANISSIYQLIITGPDIITGSRCGIPAKPGWIERVWFKPLIYKSSRYINSGHLITSRKIFDKIGGFNELLETGEDYAFGLSAQALNVAIVNNPSLEVIHYGYPKTIRQFIRREVWHGRGDCKSFQNIMSSKVALASAIFMMLHLILVSGLFLSSAAIVGVTGLTIILMCIATAIHKYKPHTAKSLIQISFLYYLYYFSRFLSCISIASVNLVRKVKKD